MALVVMFAVSAYAACPNSCSGHGTCDVYDKCTCNMEDKTSYFGQIYDTAKGYDRIADSASSINGQILAQLRSSILSDSSAMASQLDESAAVDGDTGMYARRRALAKTAFVQAAWQGPDCSLATCPRGVSWIERHPEESNLHMDFAECSGVGSCDRGTGICTCPEGYGGVACQRSTCPDDCSGHGVCVSNVNLAQDAEGYVKKDYVMAWDSGVHFGCKCSVGYRGESCMERECPSGTDPEYAKGNSQGRDCSGRGLCDYGTGECMCFAGYTSADCGSKTALL